MEPTSKAERPGPVAPIIILCMLGCAAVAILGFLRYFVGGNP